MNSADHLTEKPVLRGSVVAVALDAKHRFSKTPRLSIILTAGYGVEGDAWRCIGHVGTGFSHKVLEDLHAKLMKLTTSKSPFPAKVKDEATSTWVKPSLVAEVKFAEWTSKGELRQPVYLGLRSDKRAKDVVREREHPRK